MKKFVSILMIALMFFVLSVAAFAETVDSTGVISEETITVKKSDLPTDVLRKVEMQQNIDTIGKYAGLGKEIGDAVNGSLSAITDNANKFAGSKAGIFTMVMVAWKVMGTDAIQLCIGLLLCIVFYPMLIISFFKNCVPKKYMCGIDRNGNNEYSIDRPKESDYTFHGLALGIVTVIILITIFA